jgi:hypothetical protein
MGYKDRKKGQDKEKRKKKVNDRGSGCWFCLSNPKVEKHLVISVAEESYLALAKGPINEVKIVNFLPNTLFVLLFVILLINFCKTLNSLVVFSFSFMF